ncbi:MAG: hypothetical protein C0490_27020, partial [Marivirga sp.]|nr:hypothetical protein [Marivirga sp.]
DVSIDFSIDFTDKESVNRLKSHIKSKGSLHPPYGSDIFVFSRNLYNRHSMPALVVGRPGWDNWMIYDARKRFNKLIDLTGEESMVIHQDHAASYNSANPAHGKNFQFLPPNDPHTFVLKYCNYEWKGDHIKSRPSSEKSIKRTRWELTFAKGVGANVYWWILLKLKIFKNILSSSLK